MREPAATPEEKVREGRTHSGAVARPAFWGHEADAVRYDLTSSDSETLSLSSLLALASPEDLGRWKGLGLGYTDPRGTPEVREAIAQRHAGLGQEDVVVCAGAQEALSAVARAILGPEDHAIVILPIYPPSERSVTDLCRATGVPLVRRDGWRLDLDQVAAVITPRTRVVIANFPNSPTGATLDGAELHDLVALCRRHGLWLVNDEVYRQTGWPSGEPPPMVADLYERGISINGLSKGFGLPGLRVGWAACADRALLARVVTAKATMSTCVAASSEVLGAIALQAEGVILARTRTIGLRNRDRLAAVLAQLPHLFESADLPNLAFAFPRYRAVEGSDRLAERLRRDVGLHLLPASLWQSPLAAVPTDFVRIGLGHSRNGPAIDAFARYLSGHHATPAPT